jgi:hypothetical protein
VIVPVGGPDLLGTIAAEAASAASPALVALAESPVGGLIANDLFEKGTKRIKIAEGKPVLVDGRPVFVPAQVFPPSFKVRDAADACLYFGGHPPEFVPPPAGLYDGTEYGRSAAPPGDRLAFNGATVTRKNLTPRSRVGTRRSSSNSKC